ncbi:Isochorismatase hydrolase [Trematosphaeria pertusa]|uniref:Isochorismatase hydrolase n=1 Tax=Trematosphaeria pertusa TaxID=390896 RepID=A0A6A6HVV2_9PLEO|nr:Isochorismatase hydrolase [Trematosphaeria pertusa]KAF2242226.1 Isochorismatase hydrolase [Trematosphaeria pertusa]
MKTALLVIDMQNFFLPMTTTALPNILKLSNFFTAHSWPQFFTQHGHPPADFAPPIRNQLVRKWGADGSLHTNTPDWELIPQIAELVRAAGAPVVPKNTYDAFLGTGLEERLKAESIERVVVVGVMTDCCCDTTGRGAFNRGWETWMVSDGTGSVGEQHERGLKAWGFGYGDVITTEEVMGRLS